MSSPSPPLPSRSNQSTQFVNQVVDLKGDLKEKLTIITFNENLRAKDSQCCVCLGEFEMEEELQQIPSCKHVFHIECINHWLQANLTCPLCRTSLLPTRKPSNPGSPLRFNLLWQTNLNSNNYPHLVSATEQQGGVTSSSQPGLSSEEAPSRRNEESSGGQIGSQESISPPIDDRMLAGSNANSVVIEIQMRSA